MSAVCSTSPGKGAGIANMITHKTENGISYTCECAGISKNGKYEPTRDKNGDRFIECILHIWECKI